MSTTYTEHYNFGKQENYADLFSMKVITDNWDSLDTILYNFAAGLAGKQPTIDSSHPIDGTEVKLGTYSKATSKEDIAVNDTVKTALGKVEKRVEDNENNISLLEQMNGAKNLYKFEDLGATAGSCTGVTLTDNGDGTFSATGTASGANYARYLLKQAPIKAGIYIISGISGGALESYRLRVGTGSGDAYIVNLENNYAQFTIATDTTITVQFVVNSGVTVTNLSIKPMIITKAMYDAGFTDYQPYALSNAAITPALQECVDNGKKNYSSITTLIKNTTTAGFAGETNFRATIPAGTYVVSYDLTRSDNTRTGVIGFRDVDGVYTGTGYNWTTASHQIQTVTFNKAVKAINMYVAAGTTCTMSNLMIQTIASYNAGFTDYQPYAMSNAELTAAIQAIQVQLANQ